MKDFPVFTTEHGAASLILKEIPYRETAYIRIRDTQDPEQLLEDCVSFCRICGAKKIYAAGHSALERYPIHTEILEMRGELFLSEEEIPAMFPVTEQTVSLWREYYNAGMRNVDNAGTLETRDEEQILSSGGAYFIHENGKVLGIGWLRDTRLEAVVSVQPHSGERILRAMQSLIPQQSMMLEVASTNERAIRLYERMGFLKTACISRWYSVNI